ncbi:hypothetical protein [Cohnella soli]|uniref:Holin n=1 Tax=Cohnella soli TaxID=425005 RepID=A0ABW0HLM4_9BACL
MNGSRYSKALKGAFTGLTFTGGWLGADLLLPEPWGDYLLFGALAVVNVMAGWWIGKLSEEREQRLADGAADAHTMDRPNATTVEAEA